MKQKYKDAIQRAVVEAERKSDEPDYIGNRPMMILGQYVKGIVTDEKLEDFRPVVVEFIKQIKDTEAGQQLLEYEEPSEYIPFAWGLFTEVYNKIKYPKGAGLDAIIAKAARETYLIPELDWCEAPNVLLLARVIYELSRVDGTFFLSQAKAGEILGKDSRRGRTMLKMLIVEKVIEAVVVGNRREATKYRYIGQKPYYLTKNINVTS